MTDAVLCPDCHKPMRPVQARARTGYLIALDQCRSCGGIWFDRWELFPLRLDEVARLDSVDTESLDKAVADGDLGRCPRCDVELSRFVDANLPADARVARCRVCEGMWLQRGQLAVVKRRALENAHPKPVEDAELRYLVEKYGNQADWAQVGELDGATYEVEEAAPQLSDLGEAASSSLPWSILGFLFHLLLKR